MKNNQNQYKNGRDFSYSTKIQDWFFVAALALFTIFGPALIIMLADKFLW